MKRDLARRGWLIPGFGQQTWVAHSIVSRRAPNQTGQRFRMWNAIPRGAKATMIINPQSGARAVP